MQLKITAGELPYSDGSGDQVKAEGRAHGGRDHAAVRDGPPDSPRRLAACSKHDRPDRSERHRNVEGAMTMTERMIDPSINVMSRFKAGDRVSHLTGGEGVVVRANFTHVTVQFQHHVGIYDANWFRINPRLLFHRGTEPMPPADGVSEDK